MPDEDETIPNRDPSRRPVGWIVLALAIGSVLIQAGWQIGSTRELVWEIIFDVVLFGISIVMLRKR